MDLTQYDTAMPLVGILPTWLPPADAARIASYALYESMYHNVPEAYKIVQRGSEQNPIYIPNAKTLIDAVNRFLAVRWNFAMDPRSGSDTERAMANGMLMNLFKREEMWTKFGTQKKYGLIRGDACWHVLADPLKLPGRRLSIYELDPASYFPILDQDDHRVGCHLVDQYMDGSKTVIRRQTYRKLDNGTISYDETWWEAGGWDDRAMSGQTLKTAAAPQGWIKKESIILPPAITALPVYHWKNERIPTSVFGSSELRGLERIAAAVSQAISDEELALAMDGIGLYATTSGPPVDDQGVETTWKIGPGYVVEIDPEADWKRVSGVLSVAAPLQHIGYLEDKMAQALGVGATALGRGEKAVAESGIALALELAPLIAKNAEKEQEILGVQDHMLYDLTTMWLPTYEALPITTAIAVSVVDDPMPVNRKQVIEEILMLVTSNPPLISVAYGQQLLSEKLGMEFPDEMLADIVTEQTALATAHNQDPFQARVVNELLEATA